MQEWLQCLFNGLGTELICLAIGAIIGGVAGFRMGRQKSKLAQTQESGSGAEQYQEEKSVHKSNTNNKMPQDIKCVCVQKQKAGDNSQQTQIGGGGDA